MIGRLVRLLTRLFLLNSCLPWRLATAGNSFLFFLVSYYLRWRYSHLLPLLYDYAYTAAVWSAVLSSLLIFLRLLYAACAACARACSSRRQQSVDEQQPVVKDERGWDHDAWDEWRLREYQRHLAASTAAATPSSHASVGAHPSHTPSPYSHPPYAHSLYPPLSGPALSSRLNTSASPALNSGSLGWGQLRPHAVSNGAHRVLAPSAPPPTPPPTPPPRSSSARSQSPRSDRRKRRFEAAFSSDSESESESEEEGEEESEGEDEDEEVEDEERRRNIARMERERADRKLRRRLGLSTPSENEEMDAEEEERGDKGERSSSEEADEEDEEEDDEEEGEEEEEEEEEEMETGESESGESSDEEMAAKESRRQRSRSHSPKKRLSNGVKRRKTSSNGVEEESRR